jgi:hypothetical protein
VLAEGEVVMKVIAAPEDTPWMWTLAYPHLPKFVRHRSGIALMCPPTDDAKPAAPPEQA